MKLAEIPLTALLDELERRQLICSITLDNPEELEKGDLADAILFGLTSENLCIRCNQGHLHLVVLRPEGYANDSAQEVVH